MNRVVFVAAGATSEVLDSNDSPLGELYINSPASPEPESSTGNGTAVNSAGMQSMTSNATEGDTDAVCKHDAFRLPLQLGQNQFSVAVTAPDPPEQVQLFFHPKLLRGSCTYVNIAMATGSLSVLA